MIGKHLFSAMIPMALFLNQISLYVVFLNYEQKDVGLLF